MTGEALALEQGVDLRTRFIVGDSRFKVIGGTWFAARPISPSLAEDLGCPGSNLVLVGRLGYLVGVFSASTNRTVKVPGSSAATVTGVRGLFQAQASEAMLGHFVPGSL